MEGELQVESFPSPVESLRSQCYSRITPSPPSWIANLSYEEYGQRQGTSCIYLEVLFPAILGALQVL
jgi:hypothetical protein